MYVKFEFYLRHYLFLSTLSYYMLYDVYESDSDTTFPILVHLVSRVDLH